ncbi:hypothetical protein LTR78_002717 [Recurvomyces mirabilis]|uniref:Amidoligase enzyme-domain-containing protein n=1 Tax=Recurvomyces mirabilis TaxID=574656 RepID=A0AAE0WSC8_9PEZI|nr:hypothetical protein LTR78_002717 [Recurvomyces mirabilis]KAK5159549.1 hypothetical protein LTS14_002691 [Recurvomyces mirabilis]
MDHSSSRSARTDSIATSSSNVFISPSSGLSRMQCLRTDVEHMQIRHNPLDLTFGIEFECLLAISKASSGEHAISQATSNIYAGSEAPLGGYAVSEASSEEYSMSKATTGTYVLPHLFGREKITRVLMEPIEAICSTCGEHHLFGLDILPWTSDRRDIEHTHSKWNIGGDATIDLTAEQQKSLGPEYLDQFYFSGVEFKTRILSANIQKETTPSTTDRGHVHSITGAEEVRAVLQHLTRRFNDIEFKDELSRHSRIFTTSRCGLHVHIGNTRNRFPLQTLKNIMSLYAACEAGIDSIQTVDRIGLSTMPNKPQSHPHENPRDNSALGQYDNAYNMPLSSLHAEQVYRRRCTYCKNQIKGRFRSHQRPYRETHWEDPIIAQAANQYTSAANVALIQRAPSLGQLFQLQVNVENLMEYQDDRTNTIEFRQHAATLDHEVVLAWLDLLLKLVQFSNIVSDAEFATLYKAKFQDINWDVHPLLAVLHCEEKTIKHYAHQQAQVPEGRTYAIEKAEEEMKRVHAFGEDDLSKLLMTRMVADDTYNNDEKAKTERIQLKITRGGYGQLSDELIEKIFGSCTEPFVERLRVGYVSDEPPGMKSADLDPNGCQHHSPTSSFWTSSDESDRY